MDKQIFWVDQAKAEIRGIDQPIALQILKTWAAPCLHKLGHHVISESPQQLVDEASRVTDDLYKSIRPMLAVSNGALWLMGTPYGQRGFFYEAWFLQNHKILATGVTDPWERIKVPATECPRISKEFLEEERATRGDEWFKQEYLCEFNPAEGALFDRAMLERALNSNILPLDLPAYE